MRVVFAQVMAVIGGHQRDAQFLLQLHQVRLDALLLGQPLVLNLEVEIALAEDVVEGDGRLARLLVLAFDQFLGDFALQAGRQPNQSLRVFREEFLADPRLVIEAVQRRLGDDFHQIAVAFVVLRQDDQVVVAVALGRGAMVFFLADVELAADDRLDPNFLGGVDELDRSEDVAMVGHGHGGHAQLLDALDELLGFACSVEHGVVGVQVQMNEFSHDEELGLGGALLFYARKVLAHPEDNVENQPVTRLARCCWRNRWVR